ncbi:MAG: hypothetical protein R3C11_14195 [Planctomycetaceae bacterium]
MSHGNRHPVEVFPIPMEEQDKQQAVRRMQIICMGLMMGSITVGAVLIFLSMGNKEFITDPMDFNFLLPVVFISAELMAFVVAPANIVKQNMNRMVGEDTDTQESKLWALYQTVMIVKYALPEGAIFFCLVLFFQSGNVLTLFLVPLLLFVQFSMFPTRFKIDNWVEDKLRQLEMRG